MPRTVDRSSLRSALRPASPPHAAPGSVSPSIVDRDAKPFTLEQELSPFGAWVGEPIWVPPKNASEAFAETMLRETGPFVSNAKRWEVVVAQHRAEFTQVRELDLFESSIRLPKGRFFVSVTERENFDKIADPIPACVRTRLEEFLSGPGKKRGVKVRYLKPLCVEVGDELVMTTREDLMAAVKKIQDEVFAAYRQVAFDRRTRQTLEALANAFLALPRAVMKYAVERRRRAIAELRSRLEFERRRQALEIAKTHRQLRTNGCTFDEILNLTTPPAPADVIDLYCDEQDVSQAEREALLSIAAGAVPWFVALSLTATYVAAVSLMVATPPIVMCDPAFVAETPDAPGVLLKIGHFDQVAGVTHIEL